MTSVTLCEAKNLLQQDIAPPVAGESMKCRIARAARYVGFTYSRTDKLWYGNARRVDAEEIDRLRAAAAKKKAARLIADDSHGKRAEEFFAIVHEVRELRKQVNEQKMVIDYYLGKFASESRKRSLEPS